MAVRIESNAEPIPGYKLIERLGGGGFGEVWKCEAPGGLHKAIKFVFGSLELAGDGGQRAEQELKALSRVKTVRHPYILSTERFDIIDGQLLIVMELADRNLWDRYKECRSQGLGGIPREELLSYMEESAEALDLMNNHFQLQHLDVKPQNIFLVHQHVKVADFGLVKDLEGSQASITGGITPVYAAPETFDGKVTRFSDQYSLAIVYQELLTGQRPFAGTNVRQLIMSHLTGVPNLTPLDPPDRPIIGRSLSKEPHDRYPTCRDMVHALRRATQPEGRSEGENEEKTASPQRPAAPRPPVESDPLTLREGIGLRTPVEWTPASPAAPPPRAPDTHHPSADNQHRTQFIRRSARGVPERGGAVEADPDELPPPSAAADEEAGGAAEREGDGHLAPTLVIGLGGLGCAVLQSFRAALAERFGSPDALGNVRVLLIDTDPAEVRHAEAGTQKESQPSSSRLSPTALPIPALLAPLNRPSHYLHPRDGRAAANSWISQGMLYRIPREQLTTGARALGRLAFCDNFRVVQRRLLAEIESCRDPARLKAAAGQTGLGVRTTRPRVYVVAGLMGGTGGGMFLDLAYALRQVLRRLGYGHPDLTGLLFVPLIATRTSRQGTSGGLQSAECRVQNQKGNLQSAISNLQSKNPVPLGNTCAALAELSHFADPAKEFTARYLEKEPVLVDREPPFTRTVLLPMPEETATRACAEVVGMATRFLLGDGCCGLGQMSAEGREGLSPPPPARRGQYFETFGLYRLAYPRGQVVRRTAGLCLQKLVERWMSKNTRLLGDAVRAWVDEQWRGNELGAEHFIARVQQACEKRLGRAPEAAFAAALQPLTKQPAPPAAKPEAARGGFLSRGKGPAAAAATVLNPEDVAEVLQRYEQMLGRPDGEEVGNVGQTPPPAPVVQALREAAAAIAGEWSQKLAELPVRLIELPAFRLAGAEEAVRQVVASIEKVLGTHEPLARELAERGTRASAQLAALMAQSNDARSWPRRGGATPEDVLELLRNYPKWRYQGMVLQQVLGVYVSLRGHLTDTLREINFCRVRLGELASEFSAPPGPAAPTRESAAEGYRVEVEGPGKYLFPEGCLDLTQAVSRATAALGEEELLELDGRIQKAIRAQFVALVQVCLASNNVTRNVARAMREVAEAFVAEQMEKADVARLFLEQHAGEEQALNELINLYEEAVPEPSRTSQARTVGAQAEVTVVTAPPGTDGNALRNLARLALPETALVTAAEGEDVVIYREWSNLALTDLEHLGPLGQEAYRQLLAAENYTPHSRQDIEFELPL